MAMLEEEQVDPRGDNGSSDQLHLTKALEPKPVMLVLVGGDHERQQLVSFEMFVGGKGIG